MQTSKRSFATVSFDQAHCCWDEHWKTEDGSATGQVTSTTRCFHDASGNLSKRYVAHGVENAARKQTIHEASEHA